MRAGVREGMDAPSMQQAEGTAGAEALLRNQKPVWLKGKSRNQTARVGAGKADCCHALAHLCPHPARRTSGFG